MKFNHSTLSIIAAASIAPTKFADAHGYLKSPKSRNYYANTNGKWSGGTVSDPAPENCPHCLNRGGTDGVCGISGNSNYEQPPNAIGGLMPPVVQACYSPGSVVDFESVLTAHHKGHFEFRACPVSPGEVPTQECFDSNPLTFVEDPLYGAVPDPNHPERAYIPNAGSDTQWTYKHRYQLPSNLEGELVIIQWYYLTANSCNPEGYGDYNFAPLGISGNSLAQCGYPLPSNGVPGVPEQFWNCAEVKISTDCGASTPFPTKQPSVPVTNSPVAVSTPRPTISNAPTFKEPVTSKPTNAPIVVGPGVAVFDAALGAPRCASAASSCDSGDLLKGSSCSEPNGSNSVDECEDGSRAIQSIERISVASLSGEVFREGDMVAVAADVHAWVDGQSDVTVDIYHAVSASYPIWNLVHSEVVDGGMTTVSTNHELPGGSPTQAFRYNIRHGGEPETGCSGGEWDDVDDLILKVEPEVVTTTTTTTPPRTQNPSCPNQSGSGWGSCGPDKPCADGACCSQWGYCGLSGDFCGTCCQNGPCLS